MIVTPSFVSFILNIHTETLPDSVTRCPQAVLRSNEQIFQTRSERLVDHLLADLYWGFISDYCKLCSTYLLR